jgi:hypothetical protein
VGPWVKRIGGFVLLAQALLLCGCAGTDYEPSRWFDKPLNPLGNNLGYTYSQLDGPKQQRKITANDLVDANGACPPPAASLQTSAAPGAAENGAAAPYAQLGERVGIGMTECEVVGRIGAPTAVNIGGGRAERWVVLTYQSGPRPGVYRFRAGRLKEMDGLQEQPPPATTKKPARSATQSNGNG